MTNTEVFAEVWRGDYLECQHRGTAVIVNDSGDIVEAWGDPNQIILPRSSLKPLQALPLVTSGAAERFNLNSTHLALACASHNGEQQHTKSVQDWLIALDLNDDVLRCGPQWPNHKATVDAMIKTDNSPCQYHNNCSGKHAGFLTLSKHLDAGPEYVDPAHPVQMAAKIAIEDICEEDIDGHAIDGCSAPNFALSLTALARGMAKMANHSLTKSMMLHPELVAGTGRACSEMMMAMSGKAAIKTGAEGVFIAILPEQKLGVALKIEDGATRASESAMAALLVRLGVADAAHPMIQKRLTPVQKNRAGLVTGQIKPADHLIT
ncbi:MAG: asparaginase [Pseudomonadota bacterium]